MSRSLYSPFVVSADDGPFHNVFPCQSFHNLYSQFPTVHLGAVPPYRPVPDSSAHNMPNYQFFSMPSFCQGELFWHHFHLYVVYLGLFLPVGDICAPPSIRCILFSYLHCLPFYFRHYKRIQLVSYSVVSHLTMQGTVVTFLSNFVTANDTLPQSRAIQSWLCKT